MAYTLVPKWLISNFLLKILLANCISLCRIITCLVCITHKFVSSMRWMMSASDALWRASTALAWMRCWGMFSLTTLRKVSLVLEVLSSGTFFISQRAWVPGQYLLGHVWSLDGHLIAVSFPKFLMLIFGIFSFSPLFWLVWLGHHFHPHYHSLPHHGFGASYFLWWRKVLKINLPCLI